MRNIRFRLKPRSHGQPVSSSKWGFSLVEVVVAVGIFALAIVGVIGLLIPTSKGISDVRDADDSTRVVSAIQAYLQKTGAASATTNFAAVTGKFATHTPPNDLKDSDANNDYFYYANRAGDKIGLAGDAIWNSSTKEKYFRFALIRNTDLSPVANDTTAGFLAFTISLRWPAYLPDGTEVTSVAQKTTMIVPTAITR